MMAPFGTSRAPVKIRNLLQNVEKGGTPVTAIAPIMKAVASRGMRPARPRSWLMWRVPAP